MTRKEGTYDDKAARCKALLNGQPSLFFSTSGLSILNLVFPTDGKRLPYLPNSIVRNKCHLFQRHRATSTAERSRRLSHNVPKINLSKRVGPLRGGFGPWLQVPFPRRSARSPRAGRWPRVTPAKMSMFREHRKEDACVQISCLSRCVHFFARRACCYFHRSFN